MPNIVDGCRMPAADSFPLSPAQLGIWYAQHMDPLVPIVIAQYVDLHGELDLVILEQATIDAAMEMGSGFLEIIEHAGEPRQIVSPTLGATLEYVDLRSAIDPDSAAQSWMKADYGSPIDLIDDRLIRGAVLQLEDHRWYWYARAHHIVLDAFGARTLMTRISELYSAAVTGTEPPAGRADHPRSLYESEIDYRGSTRFETDRAHWAERMRGFTRGTSPAVHSAPPAPVNGFSRAALTTEQDALLDRAVQRHDSSPAGLVIGGFAAYLAQLNGTESVNLSLPVTARTTAAMRRSGGMLSNIVPLRLRLAHDITLIELLDHVRVQVSGALRHQRYRFEDIRRDSTGAEMVTTEFFGPRLNIMLFQNEVTLGPLVGQYHVLSTGPADDMNVNFYQNVAGSSNLIDLEYNPDVYTEDEARAH
uniref:condensation domain-containing protein n=1 Tax=Nocardia lijiangensis TaxID=299618 RepID=UPI003D73E78D